MSVAGHSTSLLRRPNHLVWLAGAGISAVAAAVSRRNFISPATKTMVSFGFRRMYVVNLHSSSACQVPLARSGGLQRAFGSEKSETVKRSDLAALRQLLVFSAPFDDDAALAVLGSNAVGSQQPSETAHAVLRSLVKDELVQRNGKLIQVSAAGVAAAGGIADQDEDALLRYRRHYISRLGQAVQLYLTGNVASSLGFLDEARTHLDRVLLEMDLPASVLPALLRALLQGHGCMYTRWTENQLKTLYSRVVVAVETPQGQQLPDYDLILAWALAVTQPDKALAV